MTQRITAAGPTLIDEILYARRNNLPLAAERISTKDKQMQSRNAGAIQGLLASAQQRSDLTQWLEAFDQWALEEFGLVAATYSSLVRARLNGDANTLFNNILKRLYALEDANVISANERRDILRDAAIPSNTPEERRHDAVIEGATRAVEALVTRHPELLAAWVRTRDRS
jgi:hypothetical protein